MAQAREGFSLQCWVGQERCLLLPLLSRPRRALFALGRMLWQGHKSIIYIGSQLKITHPANTGTKLCVNVPWEPLAPTRPVEWGSQQCPPLCSWMCSKEPKMSHPEAESAQKRAWGSRNLGVGVWHSPGWGSRWPAPALWLWHAGGFGWFAGKHGGRRC